MENVLPQHGSEINQVIRVGVVGLGYWGPNLARNFAAIAGCELAWCCDARDDVRERWVPAYPGARFTADIEDLLNDPELDAVVLATPVPTHGPLAERVLARRQALLRGEAAGLHGRGRGARRRGRDRR